MRQWTITEFSNLSESSTSVGMSGDIAMFSQQSMLATSFLPADIRHNIINKVNQVDQKLKNSNQVRILSTTIVCPAAAAAS